MTDELKPAMTPEEWARKQLAPDDPGPWHHDPNDGLVRIRDGKLYAYHESGWRYPLERPHAIAALALHGQPFGFTWEDVDRLRGLSDFVGGHDNQEWMRELADRIAALLPPAPNPDM